MTRISWMALTVLCAPLASQVDWSLVEGSSSPSDLQVVHDTASGRVFGFGTDTAGAATTEEFVAGEWVALQPPVQPSPRQGHVLAFDQARQQVVLFGGMSTSTYLNLGDTWAWNGATWTQLTPATSPSARSQAEMVYDSARQRIVLLGGRTIDSFVNPFPATDPHVWEWDGVDWTQVQSTSGPSPRFGHSLGYDSVRARTVVHGGYVGIEFSQFDWNLVADHETWEWDGSSWSQIATSSTPSVGVNAGMAFHAATGQMMLVWNIYSWTYDGVDWNELPITFVTPAFGDQVFADPAAGVVTSLLSAGLAWSWDGTAWFRSGIPMPPMFGGYYLASAPGGAGVVAVGDQWARPSHFEAWLWDGTEWAQQDWPGGPSGQLIRTAILDVTRDALLIEDLDTRWWGWDGQSWTDHGIPVAQGVRIGPYAYDESRGVVVMWGGSDTFFSQAAPVVHEFDGNSWSFVAPATLPPMRIHHAMAYDGNSGGMLLFGGQGASGFLNDTWLWDGQSWTELNPAGSPAALPGGHREMVWDAARERVVLFDTDESVWDWDGTTWTQRAVTTGPGAAGQSTRIAYDRARGRVVCQEYARTWEFGAIDPATAGAFGVGCVGSVGVPELEVGSLAWTDSTYDVVLSNAPIGTSTGLAIGFSDAVLGGAPLPIDLGLIGAPGCELLTSSELVVPGIAVAGAASLSVSVPNDPALAGLEVFHQGFVVDAAANALGVTTSGGIAMVVGIR